MFCCPKSTELLLAVALEQLLRLNKLQNFHPVSRLPTYPNVAMLSRERAGIREVILYGQSVLFCIAVGHRKNGPATKGNGMSGTHVLYKRTSKAPGTLTAKTAQSQAVLPSEFLRSRSEGEYLSERLILRWVREDLKVIFTKMCYLGAIPTYLLWHHTS